MLDQLSPGNQAEFRGASANRCGQGSFDARERSTIPRKSALNSCSDVVWEMLHCEWAVKAELTMSKYYDQRADFFRGYFDRAQPYSDYLAAGEASHVARWREIEKQRGELPARVQGD